MTSTRTHTCVYFDDGEPELVCACGSYAVRLDEPGFEDVLVALDDGRVADLAAAGGQERYAVSA